MCSSPGDHLPQERGREAWGTQESYTGFVVVGLNLNFLFVMMCVCVRGAHVHVCVCPLEKGIGSLKLKFQVVVSLVTWMLRTKLEFLKEQ